MKDEVQYLKELTNRSFDWDGIEVKKFFKYPKSKRKLNRRQHMNLEEIIDDNNDGRINSYYDVWKINPGECARQIYEWVEFKL